MPDAPEPPSAFNAEAIALRPELPVDEPFLFAVYAGTRQAELDLTGWDAATRQTFLDMQFRAMRAGYAQSYPLAAFSIILLHGQPAGRQIIDRSRERIRLVDMAMLPSFQNQGIGTFLIKRILAEAAVAAIPVRLQVLSGNRARRLYQRLGFQPAGDDGVYLEMEWRALNAPG